MPGPPPQFTAAVDGKSEHAVQKLDTFRTKLAVQMDQHFGIGMGLDVQVRQMFSL
jgi:hypothetical protein